MSALGSAVLSDDGLYRYRLSRAWLGTGGPCLFVCLNPSTADASEDDATVRRMVGFARDWGHRELLVGNLFAYRATDPRELRRIKDPIGPENAAHLAAMAGRADRIVAAWGADWMVRQWQPRPFTRALSAWPQRAWELLAEHGDVACLGTTRDGHPRHPLRLAASTPLEPLAGLYRPRPEPEHYCRCGHSWKDHELVLAGRQKARNDIAVSVPSDLGGCGAAIRPRVWHRADDDTQNLRCPCEQYAVPRPEDRTDDHEFQLDEQRPLMRSLRKPDLAVVS